MKDPCKRCGECCRLKVRFGFLSIALDEYCPQYTLDNSKGFCMIYGKHTGTRIGNEGICLSVEQMIMAHLLPESCPYAKKIPGYKSLVINY